ncbi:Nn.00g036910.m01.CDS01 [Neocucurbitaria sp. VM-36]
MDIRLTSWLEHTFQEQLLLGNSWLQDKNKRKESGVRTAFDRDWEDLYHDNGSCLDITNSIHPERNSTLQVVQTNPLTLTDGRYQVVAHHTDSCVRDVARPLLLHAVIAVRKYTIQYTSYGPPRAQLRFILHSIAWLGENTEKFRGENSEPNPLYESQEISAVLKQLRQTRAREDLRCLRSATHLEVDEAAMAGATNEVDGAPIGQSTPYTQLPHTQLFGTQISHPIRSRTSDEEPQILGVKRLEPVLAGNTKRAEILPNNARSDDEARMALLSLLDKTTAKKSPGKPSPASTKGFIRTAFDDKQSIAEPTTTHTSSKSLVTVDRQSARAGAEEHKERRVSATPTRNRTRVRGKEPISPINVQSADELSDMGQHSEHDSVDNNDTAEWECSWMKGLIFNREALRVPLPQQLVLQKETSWHKPQPGCMEMPSGNIPITILETLGRIADEKAAVDGASDTDSEDDFDPSPDSVVDNVDPSPEDTSHITQDGEPTTSQVSWSVSPSPEPPQKPTRTHQGLPPDSSFESEQPNTTTDIDHQRTVSRPPLQQAITIDSSNEHELTPPLSSPPIPKLPDDSDEEMEMETLVPIGLGDDAQQTSHPQSISDTHHRTSSPRLKPVLQVKETPYAKGKKGEALTFANSPAKQKQGSRSNSKPTPSTSIVYGTYNALNSSASLEGEIRPGVMRNDINKRSQNTSASAPYQTEAVGRDTASEAACDAFHDSSMPSPPLDSDILPQQGDEGDRARATPSKVVAKEPLRSRPDPTPASTRVSTTSQSPLGDQLPHAEATSPKQHETPSGLTKRKMNDSPSKNGRRHSKRREIKIVGFGDDAPSTINPTTALRQERAESLRKFREERKSSLSFESRPRPDHMQQDPDAMEVDSPGGHTSNTSLRSMSPRHRSLYEEPGPSKQPSKAVSAPRIPSSNFQSDLQTEVAQPSKAEPLTVFQAFKAAYPEYTGGTKHFEGLCIQMYELDLQDKMVPKWQWDDFIMRNRTDYKDYAVACADQGENPEPYYRFYKDSIRDTLFKRGIIESRDTLLRALDELGEQPRLSKEPTETNKASRASLPGTFTSHKKPAHDRFSGRTGDRPRHSLPTGSRADLRTPNRTPPAHKTRSPSESMSHRDFPSERPTPTSTHRQRLAEDQLQSTADDTNEGSGDPFRDYFFAVKRNTSWTGSTKVDKRMPWPRNLAVRPSIEDTPKSKVDALKWRDEL